MFKGIIELESLNNTAVLKSKDIKIVSIEKEKHPEANTKIWHEYKVKIPSNKMRVIAEGISKETKDEWGSIFWDNQTAIFVFKNKIFYLKREKKYKSKKYKELKYYTIKHGIQQEYIDLDLNIRMNEKS